MEACKCDQTSRGAIQAGSNLTLAMAAVPLQAWEALYPPETALARGTVFQSLDLPFFAGGDDHV